MGAKNGDDLCDGYMHISCVSGMEGTRVVIRQREKMAICAYVMRSNVKGKNTLLCDLSPTIVLLVHVFVMCFLAEPLVIYFDFWGIMFRGDFNI